MKDKYVEKLNRYYARKAFMRRVRMILPLALLIAWVIFMVVFLLKTQNFL